MRRNRSNLHVKSAALIRPTLNTEKRAAVFLAPFLALTIAGSAFAQEQAGESALVDISDPNVSIDLSVLDDGGLTPQMGAPLAASAPMQMQGKVSKAPGAKAPVSTLYIQPAKTRSLPPQTKPIFAMPTPAPVQQRAVEAPPAPEPVEQQVVAAPPPPPPISPQPAAETAPVPAPVPVPAPAIAAKVPEPEPAPVPEPVKEVAKVEPAPVATPAPTTAPAPVAPPAAPQVEEVQAPPSVTDVPPPPPQALTQPATPPASVDETQTAPAATGPALVVDLPPKDSATNPGVASLPPATGPLGDGDNMRIVFEQDSSKLPPDARSALKALSDQMRNQETLRLQLLAYAGDTDTSASAARRLSLSRALAVRSFLIESGVRSTRIDVRALGNKSTDAVTERVDITVVER